MAECGGFPTAPKTVGPQRRPALTVAALKRITNDLGNTNKRLRPAPHFVLRILRVCVKKDLMHGMPRICGEARV